MERDGAAGHVTIAVVSLQVVLSIPESWGSWLVGRELSGSQGPQPCPLLCYSSDVICFLLSVALCWKRSLPDFQQELPGDKRPFILCSYLCLCCLITSAALFWEPIFLVLKNKFWPRSNFNLPPAHLADCLLHWGQLSTKNLLVILAASFYCGLWYLVQRIVSPCPESKF